LEFIEELAEREAELNTYVGITNILLEKITAA
jgi:hypothetical protein